ncbi:MAG TPA: SDR family oxidoreductase [Elusimicrobiota bacterium]|nr:SDR family oxidoreductase [Elusimicrobiota bacterium]
MILVTGATGTVGRPLVLELKERRAAFRVLARDPNKARNCLGDVDCAVGDLSRPETVAKALAGVEAAFLLSPLDPRLPAWEAGFARAARKAGVKRLVKLSALGADVRSPFAIARWHGEAEEEVRRVGVPCVVLRPAAFHQNLLREADSIRRGVLRAPMGTARVAMVDARDAGISAAAALTSPALDGETLTLTGPAPLTYAEAAATFSKVLGRPVAYTDVAPELARAGMAGAGMPAWLADAVLGLAESFRSGAADLSADGVRRATGREPVSFERFVRDQAAAFR